MSTTADTTPTPTQDQDLERELKTMTKILKDFRSLKQSDIRLLALGRLESINHELNAQELGAGLVAAAGSSPE